MIKESVLEERLKNSSKVAPKKRSLSVKEQERFSFWAPPVNRLIGDFYETLAKAIFGGTIERTNLREDVEPDLRDEERSRYIEVKAVARSGYVMLKDAQIDKYVRVQLSDHPISKPRVYFTIFRYKTRRIGQAVEGMDEDNMIKYFAGDTAYMVGLPFSMVYEMHRNGNSGSAILTRSETNGTFHPRTNLSTRMIESLFLDPIMTIENLRLNRSDYKIRHAGMRRGVRINNHEIEPFPMTLIKSTDNTHRAFIQYLTDLRNSQVPF